MEQEIWKQCRGFEWDKGNTEKSWLKHQVSRLEAEQVFFNQPFIVTHDAQHSHSEQRYYALGKTDKARTLFIVFTVRKEKIRVISVRDMNKKERGVYEKTT